MKNELIIRLAQVSDAAQVADLYLASRQQFVPHAPLVHSDEDVRRWIKEVLIPGKRVTLAIVDRQIAGMCAVSEDDAGSWIDQLYVRPGYTGKGIGTALLDESIPRLRLPVCLYTFQASTRARNFYERYGFKAVKFSDGSGNEEGVPDVLYELTTRR